MSKTYRVGAVQRIFNSIFRKLAVRGKGARYLHVLTVTGRSSGQERSVPIDVMDVDGTQYLVSPYGEVNWVRNLRASRIATLRRGADVETYDAVELEPAQSVKAIREYVRSVPVTKSYWNVTGDSTDGEVAKDAVGHPVFELTPRQRSTRLT